LKIRGDIRSSRFATGVNDTGGKWKKSSIRKILIILFGHLWVIEETYIYKFLPSSSLSGVCSLILFQLFAAGVVDTGGKFAAGVVDTPRWQICHRCQQHKGNWWQNLSPVSSIPVANLPPVSLIPAAICHRRH
jgi:hypothetical protein